MEVAIYKLHTQQMVYILVLLAIIIYGMFVYYHHLEIIYSCNMELYLNESKKAIIAKKIEKVEQYNATLNNIKHQYEEQLSELFNYIDLLSAEPVKRTDVKIKIEGDKLILE
jgi:hypothetical protein